MGNSADNNEGSTSGNEDKTQLDTDNEELNQGVDKGETGSEDSTLDDDHTGEDAPQFTQAELDRIVLKQKEKLSKQKDAATSEASASNVELELEREKSKILELALEQQKQLKAGAEPNPDDFDDGEDSLEYKTRKKEHDENKIKKIVAETVAVATQQTQVTQDANNSAVALEAKQSAHYENVKKANIKEYFTHEDAAIEILGNEVVNQIIDNFAAESHLLLNYLGLPANKAEAEQIVNLIKTKPVQGVAKLGGIIASKLTINPNSNTQTPDPNKEIKGGSVPNLTADDRKLEKLREKAAETGDMAPLMAFKKEIAARG